MCSCGDEHAAVVSGRHIYAGGEALTVSRRDLLKGGVAAVAGTGAAALFGQSGDDSLAKVGVEDFADADHGLC